MKSITTYLKFDGNAREAMEFYHSILGGTFDIQTFGDSMPGGSPPGAENRVIHARITIGSLQLMASDTMPGMASDHRPGSKEFALGDNFAIALECDDHAEQDRHFKMFSEGGKVLMPLDMMFWGARFGMVLDKFGVEWMFNCESKKA